MKRWIARLLSIFPQKFWEKTEYVGAYAQGKGAGSSSLDAEVKAAERFIPHDQNGLVFFDVGANQGHWAADAVTLFGDRLKKIYLFEPSPHNVALLEKTFSSDGRVSVVANAVSDGRGSAQLFSDVPGSGIASLHKRNLKHFGVAMDITVSISTITIDDFIAEQNITRVDFMKMDIEGHEFSALNGAKKSLESEIIRAFSFEFGGANIDSRTYFQDYWYFLSELGYSLFRILPNGSVRRIKKYTEMLECFRTTNYIAVLGDAGAR